ncbi:MAG: PLxRFG domain-containing protein [Candidatus Thorarchaeota archaeon]
MKRGYYIKTPEYGKMWEQAVTEAEAIAGVTEAMRESRMGEVQKILKDVEEARKKMGELERMMVEGPEVKAPLPVQGRPGTEPGGVIEPVRAYIPHPVPVELPQLTRAQLIERLVHLTAAYESTKNPYILDLIRKTKEEMAKRGAEPSISLPMSEQAYAQRESVPTSEKPFTKTGEEVVHHLSNLQTPHETTKSPFYLPPIENALPPERALLPLAVRLIEAVNEYKTASGAERSTVETELNQYASQLRAMSVEPSDTPARLAKVLEAYVNTANPIYIPLIERLHAKLKETLPVPDHTSILFSLIDTYRQHREPAIMQPIIAAKERILETGRKQMPPEIMGQLNLKLGELMHEYGQTKDQALVPLITELKTLVSELKAQKTVETPAPQPSPSMLDRFPEARKKYTVEPPRWEQELSLRMSKTDERPLSSASDDRLMYVTSAADEFVSRLGIDRDRIMVYRGPSEFPDHIKPYTEGHKVYAWYENGKVHLNAAEITDRHTAHRILFEELINHGYFPEVVRAAGDDLNKFYATVYKLYRDDPTMKKVIDDYGFDTSTTAGIIAAGKEYFAHYKYSALSNPTLFDRFVMLIREVLRKLGIDLGMSKVELDKYIREMTAKALKRTRNEQRGTEATDSVLARAPKEEMRKKGVSPELSETLGSTMQGKYELEDIMQHPELYEKYPQLRLSFAPDKPPPEFRLEKKREVTDADLNPILTLRALNASPGIIKSVVSGDAPPAKLTFEHAPFEFLLSRTFGHWNVEKIAKEHGIDFEKLPSPYRDLHGTTLRNRVKQYFLFPRRVAEKYPQAYPLYESLTKYKTNELKNKSEYLEMMRNYLTIVDEESLLRINKFLSDRMQLEHKAMKTKGTTPLAEVTPEYLSSLGFTPAEVDAIMTVRATTQKIAGDLKNETLNRMWVYDEYPVPATSQQIVDIIKQEKEKLQGAMGKNFDEVRRRVDRIRSMNEIKRIVRHFEALEHMTYIPHTRPTGKYFIIGTDKYGKVQYYNRYNSAKELKEILRDLEGSGLSIRTGAEYKSKVPEILHMPPYFVVLLKNAIEKLKAVGALSEGMKDLDTEISKLMNAWGIRGRVGKHFITPRFVAGYDYRHMKQALTKYVLSVGSLRARNQMYEQFRNALDRLHMERDAPLINYYTKVRDAMLTPTHPGIAQIKALMFLMYLGNNFKSFVINSLQPVSMTWGYTTRYAGIKRGTVINAKAMKMAVDYQLGKKERLPADLVAFLDEKQKTGEINPQTVRELVGLGLRGEMSKFERAVDYGAFLFNTAERNNRTHASIVAYLLAKEKGLKKQAIEKFVRQFVGDTQVYYEKAERPLALSHRYLELAGIYRLYAWNFISLMKELVKAKDFKALGHILGVHLILGGGLSLPWMSDVLQILAKAGVDIEDMLREESDPELANVLVYGVPALAGISIGQALAPTAVDISEVGTTTGLVRTVLGVAGDFITRIPKAVSLYYHNRDLWRAAEYFLPESLRNITTAIRWQIEGGIRTPTLQKLSDAEVYDSILRSLGIQPMKVIHAYRQSLREQIVRHAVDMDTRDYNLRVAKALFKGDMDELAKAYEELMDHNMRCIQKGELHKVIKLSDRAIRMNLLRMVDPQAYKIMITRELARPEMIELQQRWEVGR